MALIVPAFSLVTDGANLERGGGNVTRDFAAERRISALAAEQFLLPRLALCRSNGINSKPRVWQAKISRSYLNMLLVSVLRAV
jgi:hypothetical protein